VTDALAFAIAAGDERLPSPSAIVGGSPNRSFGPDPVRHMSVISGPAEHATANYGDLRRLLERVVMGSSVLAGFGGEDGR
jgi:hypothetical protein